MDKLGVGGNGALYFDGEQIALSKKITLTWMQGLFAIMAAVATAAVAVVEVFTFLGYGPHICP
ncbi:MAG: hypothetical protein KUA35_10110 [Pseudodesulfovibrio sp.]|nr:hypothetical protein [Pseudodesulfovibrio aespoeensis]MBU4244981.1 hypothetical protein [Pseudomonadota bacterium]MBV1764187.1 hypothetical protein [Pseudodesulfovibrio sp.]MBU4473690.1 hypothetical protein [Pseudomonadota bacterium]MBU4558620.1 hypothetical protein [Pseudomonadota bacterium]MBV1772763.1 hypothetical protein [Pseudodesulfovibrio sp.]